MKDTDKDANADASAAQWFVDIDARRMDAGADAHFAAWLGMDPARDAELARCEAAIELTRQLGIAAKLGHAFDAAASIAADPTPPRSRWRRLREPAVAWVAAAASLTVAVLVLVQGGLRAPSARPSGPAAAATSSAAVAAGDPANDFRVDVSGAESAVVLPGQIIVDARSVAVLPFVDVALAADPDEGGALAAALYDEILRQLAAIPGIYVVDRQAVAPYAGSEIEAEEIAAQLGVRGIVEARVGVAGGRIQLLLSLTDAARAGPPMQDAFESPVESLGAMRAEIVTNIALALAAAPVPPAYVPSPQ